MDRAELYEPRSGEKVGAVHFKRRITMAKKRTPAQAQYVHLIERLTETLDETTAPLLLRTDRLNAIIRVAHNYALAIADPRFVKEDRKLARRRQKK
jgi:hypothetical protein